MLSVGKVQKEVWWPIDSDIFAGEFLFCSKGITESQMVQNRKSFMCVRGKFKCNICASDFLLKIAPKKVDISFAYKLVARLFLRVLSKKYPELSTYDITQAPAIHLPVLKYADIVYKSPSVSDIGLIQDNFGARPNDYMFQPDVAYSFGFFQNYISFDDFTTSIYGIGIDLEHIIGDSLPFSIMYKENTIFESEFLKCK